MKIPTIRRLNNSGFSHHLVMVFIVLSVAIGGTFYLVASHADSVLGNGRIYGSNTSVNPDGTGMKTIAGAFNDPTTHPFISSSYQFSRDNSKVTFISSEPATITTTGTNYSLTKLDLIVMNSDGSGSKTIALDIHPFKYSTPRWSPDGQWIEYITGTYVTSSSGNPDPYVTFPYTIHLIHPDGSGSKIVSLSLYQGQNQFPVIGWIDSQHLGLVQNSQFCSILLDGTNETCNQLVAPDAINSGAEYTISPDGTKLIFTDQKSVVVAKDSSGKDVLGTYAVMYEAKFADAANGKLPVTKIDQTIQPTSTQYTNILDVTWSPDGTQIAYLSQAWTFNLPYNGGASGNPGILHILHDGGGAIKTIEGLNTTFVSWQPLIANQTNYTLPGTSVMPTPYTSNGQLTFTSPTTNAPLYTPTLVTAAPSCATCTNGVVKVEFYVDGELVSYSDTAPYSFTADPSRFSSTSATHTIVAKGLSASGSVVGIAVLNPILAYGFTPLTPARIADTRPNSGQPYANNTLGGGQGEIIQVTGVGGVPKTGVSAVVLQAIVASATSGMYLSVTDGLGNYKAVSTVNAAAGQVANEQTITPLDQSGSVFVYNSAGTTNFVLDVVGYYSDGGNTYVPITPARIVDTRSSLGSTTFAAGATNTIQVQGKGGVPLGATAVVVNTAVVNPLDNGYLTLYPTGQAKPLSSMLNYTVGQTLAKEATIKLGTNGEINAYASAGTNIIMDVSGYFVASSTGYKYVPVVPTRIVDTRTGSNLPYAGQHILGGQSLGIAIDSSLVLSGAKSVVVNVTIPNNTGGSYFTAYNSGTTLPNTSNINYTPGNTLTNEVNVKLGADGKFNLYNSAGTGDAIVDVLGYYY